MKLKDATRRFGSVGLLFPLIVIFLATADSAFACPGHKNGVAHRTSSINTKTASLMKPIVISYGGPASSRGCIQTRGTRYVAVRNIDYDDDAPRYVAVRNYAPRKYVAVRNIDYDDDAPRYVAVRNYAPRTKYVAVRNIDYDDDAPRYVAVRNIDYDEDEPRYVTVNYAPRIRHVAVRNIDYDDDVPDLDQVETTSTRHVVVKSDYVTGTEEVVYPNVIDNDDTALTAAPINNDTTDVAYTDATSMDGNGESFLTASDMESMYPEAEAVPIQTRTISYVSQSDDGDIDDQTFLEGGGVTDVASIDENGESSLSASEMESMYPESEAVPVQTRTLSYVPESDDFDADFNTDYRAVLDEGGEVDPAVIENAYLNRVEMNTSPNDLSTSAVKAILDEGGVVDPTVIENAYLSQVAMDTSTNIASTSEVSYVPADDVDDNDSFIGIDPMYAEPDDAAQSIQYVLVNDDTVVDADTTYFAASNVDHDCACNDELGTDTVSYVPADDVEDMDAENVVYVPVDDLDVQTVSYVPVDSVEATYVVAHDCPTSLSDVDADPSYDSYY